MIEWLFAALLVIIAFFLGRLLAEISFRKREKAIRKDAANRSRSVIKGQISEQLAPYLPDFPYKPSEIRFLGKPIDFIVFEGLDEKQIDSVRLVEVKSGKASLSAIEKKLKEAVDDGRVTYEIYRVEK